MPNPNTLNDLQAHLSTNGSSWRVANSIISSKGGGTTLSSLNVSAANCPPLTTTFSPVPPSFPSPSTSPSYWDWRNNPSGHNYVYNLANPTGIIKNQGAPNSCAAFAISTMVESRRRIQAGNPSLQAFDISEAAVYFNLRTGSTLSPGTALNFLNTHGICREAVCLYDKLSATLSPPSSRETSYLQLLKIDKRGSGNVFDNVTGVANIKKEVELNGPVIAQFDIYEDFYHFWHLADAKFDTHRVSIYKHSYGAKKDAHVVAVIGFHEPENGNPGYWICRNSWGLPALKPRPNDDGCFKIAFGECGIENSVFAIGKILPLNNILKTPGADKLNTIGVTASPSTSATHYILSTPNKFDNKSKPSGLGAPLLYSPTAINATWIATDQWETNLGGIKITADQKGTMAVLYIARQNTKVFKVGNPVTSLYFTP